MPCTFNLIVLCHLVSAPRAIRAVLVTGARRHSGDVLPTVPRKGVTKTMYTYNRDQARRYARWYANAVCHDGAVACVRSGRTVFERYDPLTNLRGVIIDGADDCTHFISCCIGHHGGSHLGKGG